MPVWSWNALIESLAADIPNRNSEARRRQVQFDVVRYFSASRTNPAGNLDAWSGFPKPVDTISMMLKRYLPTPCHWILFGLDLPGD